MALLVERGFVVLGRNVRVGRLELDVVARRGSLLVFLEVRARDATSSVHPAETVDAAKQRRLRRAASAWLVDHPHAGPIRFDVASVRLRADEGPIVELFENAF